MRNSIVSNGIGIRLLVLVFALAILPAAGGTAYAISDYLPAFNARYGTTGTALDTCTVCHTSVPARNPYGAAFAANAHNFATIEPLDSDGDGFTNLVEITARTFPGNAASFPAVAAPTITTTSPLPAGTVGVAYSQTFAATGGTPPYTWAITAGTPPAGLTLSAAGVLSGTPTTAGTSTFTVQVTGGGSSTMVFSLTINAVADTTPPTVLTTVPDNNATGVTSSIVTATFSEPILAASVTDNTFFVSNGVDNVAGTRSVSGAVVTFTPAATLADNTTYTWTLTTGITDLAGNALAANQTRTFTTAAVVVTPPPVVVSSDGGGGCAMTRTRGDIKELAGAYGFLMFAALGMALRRRIRRGKE